MSDQMSSNETNPRFITPQEFRQQVFANGDDRTFGGFKSVYKLLKAGKVRHIKVGRRYLILRSELEDFPEREAEGGSRAA